MTWTQTTSQLVKRRIPRQIRLKLMAHARRCGWRGNVYRKALKFERELRRAGRMAFDSRRHR